VDWLDGSVPEMMIRTVRLCLPRSPASGHDVDAASAPKKTNDGRRFAVLGEFFYRLTR